MLDITKINHLITICCDGGNRQKIIGSRTCYHSRVSSNQSDTELLLFLLPPTIYRGNIIKEPQAHKKLDCSTIRSAVSCPPSIFHFHIFAVQWND